MWVQGPKALGHPQLLSQATSRELEEHIQQFLSFFFFKDLFIYFYWKARYTERRRDRKEDLLSNGLLPKRLQSRELSQSDARSQDLFQVYHAHTGTQGYYCLPRPQAGSWMGSRAAGIRTDIHMGSWGVQGEDFSH